MLESISVLIRVTAGTDQVSGLDQRSHTKTYREREHANSTGEFRSEENYSFSIESDASSVLRNIWKDMESGSHHKGPMSQKPYTAAAPPVAR